MQDSRSSKYSVILASVANAIEVSKSTAWLGDDEHKISKLDLKTGTISVHLESHTEPVTSLAFIDGDETLLASGSCDKTIKTWNVETSELVSSTNAHSDKVQALHAILDFGLLASSGADNLVKLWDISAPAQSQPLSLVGVIKGFRHCVQAFQSRVIDQSSLLLYTGDRKGRIRTWKIEETGDKSSRITITEDQELPAHDDGVNSLVYSNLHDTQGRLFTASQDETVRVIPDPADVTVYSTIQLDAAVKTLLPMSQTSSPFPGERRWLLAGSATLIRLYDMSHDYEEKKPPVSAHDKEVIALRYWQRPIHREAAPPGTFKGPPQSLWESWIVSTSVDQTVKIWKLEDLLA